ncbi:MAG: hypothetical protein A3J79_11285 [Elusimicrobia bacterium RIFOXYB2_FULL_62_6]|nr:MAG: hypothetical protein A3J79_11285 [Elusimicrobia bacterium RIFOXYB2_FULL_62_6]
MGMPQKTAGDGAATARERLKAFRELAGLAAVKRGYRNDFFLADLLNMDLAAESHGLSAAELRRSWLAYADRLKRAKEKHLLQLYIGTPYCRSRCAYCIYFHNAGTPAALEKYKDALLASIKYYSAVFGKLVFENVYFGGGSPGLFSEAQLRQLCAALKSRVRWSADGERSFEFNPDSVTPAKLRIVAEAGFNRASFGVQSFNGEALRAIGRGRQTEKMVEEAVRWAREAGFSCVNLDLMLGLPRDGGDNLAASFGKAAALAPDSIMLYPCKPAPRYLEKCFGGDAGRFRAALRRHGARLRAVAALAARGGFVPREKLSAALLEERNASAIRFFGPGHKETAPHYAFSMPGRPMSIFGLGHHANSRIHGVLNYYSRPLAADPARNTYRGVREDGRRGMTAFVLEELGRGRTIPLKKFRGLFGVSPETAFPEAVSLLKALGKVRVRGGSVALLAKTPRDRFTHAMFFLPYEEVSASLRNLREGATERTD